MQRYEGDELDLPKIEIKQDYASIDICLHSPAEAKLAKTLPTASTLIHDNQAMCKSPQAHGTRPKLLIKLTADLTQNPFASTHSLDTNPFEDPVPLAGRDAQASRAETLEQRERDLERRERELNQKAEHIRVHGRNNWPPCATHSSLHSYTALSSKPCVVYPLIFHSIAEEIPEASRPLITRLYQLWLVLLLTLIINMVACIFVLLAGSSDGGRDLGASIGYTLASIT